jgi:acyl transferase domain-containing protein/acyl carrier protein
MIFTPDGHCRAFDVQSAGTIGSNGVGIVVLKRLQDALADGDVIHAVIKGSAINNDGARKVGYTAPSVDGQMNAIRQALANAAVDPATIAYIETHGTGTKLGDPIELAAIKEIFQAPIAEAVQRGTERLVLGAVKTNFGHLDAAAGITGLIKTALALKHGLVPPTLHFTAPNPELGFPQQIFQINTELLTWPAKNSPRRAGVSSFGIGGTNAHAILEEAPPPTTAPAPGRRTHHLLTLSAKNGAALQALAMEYADFLATFAAADQNTPLADICYTTHVGRSHFDHRLSIVGAAPEELRQKLLAYRPEETGTGEREGRSKQRKQRTPAPIAFLFTGQGAQYHGMGQILYETQPTFRATLDRCDGILRACLGRSLLELLYGAKTPDLPTNELLESHPCGQAVNFALECALADLWRAWGIEPDFVLGHSLGDFAAAYSAGVISLEDGLRLVTARGQFMESAHGQMVAVMAAEAEVLPFLAGVADVAIAVINGPQSVVISGAHAAIQQVNARLQAAGIKTRPLAIPVAAHSPLLDPILDDFADTVRGLTLTAPTVAVVSSMTGQLVQDEVTDPAYWRQHLRNPVRFADGVRTLYERGCRIFIEIGPKPTLLGLVEQIIDAGAAGQGAQGEIAPSAPVLLLPSLRENQDDWRQMLDSLGQLYTQGVPIDWHGFEQDYQPRKVELPTYPFQRRRYWIDAPQQKQLEKQAPKQQQQATGSIRPLIDNMVHTRAVGLTTFETAFHVAALPFLADYRLADSANRLLAPSTCQLALILDAAELAFGDTPCLLEEVVFADPLLIPTDGERTVQLLLTGNRPPNHSFPQPSDKSAVHSFDLSSFAATTQTAEDKDPTIVTHATGRLSPLRGEAPPAVDLTLLRARCTTPLDLAVRDAAGLSGIQIGPTLRWLTHLWRGEGEVLGQLALPDAVKTLTGYRIHPGVLESCLAIIASLQPASTQPALISRLGTVRCYQPVTGTAWWCHLRLTGAAIGDIQLLNEAGEFLLAITGIEVSATQWAAIQQQGESWRDWLYQVEWQPQPLAPTPPQTATHHWLIFADEQGLSEALAQTLQQRGDQVTRVCAGTAYQAVDEQTFVIRPAEATDYRRLMATLSHTTGAITDVVHCWSLDSAVTAQVCDLATGAYQSCGTTLHLVQALLHEYPTPPHLWLITRGAQAVQRQEAVTGFAQAALWGMGKTIALEHPELHCVCIDLAESTALATQSNALCAVLVADKVSAKTTVERLEPRENQLALRSGHWYAPRLQPYKPMKQYSSPNGTDLRARAPLRADATYLITGGLGGLGLAVAQWLVEQGASHLILMGRSQPTAEAQMKVARMQALGAQIRVVQADVSEEAQVAALLATISVDYPLRGIIHAAGVLADASLLQQRWQQFDQLFAPKVYGAWHLHKLTQQLPLDFFVFFSSLAGMLGNRGQANHAAANAALDALAHYRQALGLPALSINWAGWLGVGTAVRLQENGTHPSHWAGQGLGGYSPEQGVEAFANLLQQPAAQIGCMRIDWRHYLDEQRRAMPFYRSFADKAAMASQPQSRRLEAALLQAGDSAITIYTQLQQAAPKMRPALIRSELQAEVMRLLRLGSPQQIEMDQGLIELGMDSLMAIELRNRLQKSLQIKIPAAKFLEGITLTGIIDFLLEQFQTEHDAATTTMKNAVKHNEHGWETLAALPSETSLSKVKEIAL